MSSAAALHSVVLDCMVVLKRELSEVAWHSVDLDCIAKMSKVCLVSASALHTVLLDCSMKRFQSVSGPRL